MLPGPAAGSGLAWSPGSTTCPSPVRGQSRASAAPSSGTCKCLEWGEKERGVTGHTLTLCVCAAPAPAFHPHASKPPEELARSSAGQRGSIPTLLQVGLCNQVSPLRAPPSSVSSASAHAAAHLSWRLRAGTAGRQVVRTVAGPFSARWRSLRGHRSYPGRRWLPFLPSLQFLRGREEGRALRHCTCSIISLCPAPAGPLAQTLLCTKCRHIQLCHRLCHHPVAKAISDTLRSQSPLPRGGS